MKRILLTRSKYAYIDDKDFNWLNQWNWYFQPHHTNNGYAIRREKVSGKWVTISMARQILNPPKGKFVDHINGDKLDNRKKNLRIATIQQNNVNKLSKKLASKTRGVIKHHNKWQAAINFNKKFHFLGSFSTQLEAAKAYDKAALRFFGEFAITNY